ncbi:hypothetical protein GCM10009646_19470 [Streptomyces aureus]
MRIGSPGQQVGEERGPGGGARGHFVMAEDLVLAPQSGAVVAPSFLYEFRDGTPHGTHDRAP